MTVGSMPKSHGILLLQNYSFSSRPRLPYNSLLRIVSLNVLNVLNALRLGDVHLLSAVRFLGFAFESVQSFLNISNVSSQRALELVHTRLVLFQMRLLKRSDVICRTADRPQIDSQQEERVAQEGHAAGSDARKWTLGKMRGWTDTTAHTVRSDEQNKLYDLAFIQWRYPATPASSLGTIRAAEVDPLWTSLEMLPYFCVRLRPSLSDTQTMRQMNPSVLEEIKFGV